MTEQEYYQRSADALDAIKLAVRDAATALKHDGAWSITGAEDFTTWGIVLGIVAVCLGLVWRQRDAAIAREFAARDTRYDDLKKAIGDGFARLEGAITNQCRSCRPSIALEDGAGRRRRREDGDGD